MTVGAVIVAAEPPGLLPCLAKTARVEEPEIRKDVHAPRADERDRDGRGVLPGVRASIAWVTMVTLLLPGMDGTGRLFRRILPLLDPALGARVVSYQLDRTLGYGQLLHEVEVPVGPLCIIAESFSGPLAVVLASRHAAQVRGLVLAASFVRSPSVLRVRMAAALGAPLFRLRLPDFALRVGMLGADATDAEVRELREALESIQPDVLAHRLDAVARVDVTELFASSATPTMYLAGARDRLVGVRVAKELQRLRPEMRSHALDAPHLVLQRAPVEAAALVNAFLLPLVAS